MLGVLLAVVDLSVNYSLGSVTISWTAPFSLDVTGVNPDIWYSVLVYNTTEDSDPTAVPCADCINITETHYTFTPDYPSPCHVYSVSVVPFNGAGQGQISPNVTTTAVVAESESAKTEHNTVLILLCFYLQKTV